MSRQIQIRRGTAAEHSNFVGAIGEITMDTTNKTLRVHDGVTNGGNEIMSVNKFYSLVTDCITNIPQNIKLELSSGTLTLKAGSKVYIPNGSGIFNEVVINTDKTLTSMNNTECLVWYDSTISALRSFPKSICFSGNTEPTGFGTYALWYDTVNNKIKFTGNSGSSWTENQSLPISVITGSNNVPSLLNQVFNGFGYIGSTIFVLPGIKGLVPNGKNSDGTLNNIVKSNSSVVTRTDVGTSINNYEIALAIGTNFMFLDYDSGFYVSEDNHLNNHTGTIVNNLVFATYSTDANKQITDFKTKSVVRNVCHDDTRFISNQSMPSKKYINLTLAASGSTYTAPADGYFTINKTASAAGEYVFLLNSVNGLNNEIMSSTMLNCRCFLPVSKGDSIQINYTLTGATNTFRFVYSNGAK